MARQRHREKRVANTIEQLPWRDVVNPYGPTSVLDDDQLERIIDGALIVLETQGMRFLEGSSRQHLKSAGAEVDESSKMVRFDRELVKEKLLLAPEKFGLQARNPEHNLTVGGEHIIFTAILSSVTTCA
jgi:trimethylamine--corrinoid protein Co-methyltransferase